jgi:serine/threonine-protein kinase
MTTMASQEADKQEHARPGTGSMPATVGKYRVEGVIGRGAIGIVYKGHDPSIDRPVAIKSLRQDVLDEVDDRGALLKRFAHEARSAGRCQHPNIVTVYDYVEHDGAPYIIMEFVAAGTLETVTRSGAKLPLRQVGEIMVQLLMALDHAHGKGVIHRDVKPANILCPAATTIKVTDFGVARFQNMGLTAQGGGIALGTPNYMAPEQFLGRPVDARTDLFAAGIVLYQLLTGTKPFLAADLPNLMRKLLNESAPTISLLRPDLWRFDEVVQRAMARNPTDRYQTADIFIAAINRAMEHSGEASEAPLLDLTKLSHAKPADSDSGSSRDLSRTMAERLTPRTMDSVEQALARAIGPIARIVVRKAAKEATDADKMLSAMCAQIPIEKEAVRFRSAAEAFLRKDEGVAAIQLDAVISEQEIRQATELLLPLIGPVAKIFAERHAATAVGREDYYEHLAEAIPSAAEREAFLKACRNAPAGRKT